MGEGGRRRTLARAAATAALLAAATALVGSRARSNAYALVHPPRERVSADEAARAKRTLPGLEEVSFATSDGLTLRGWFVPGPRRATVLFVHGGGGNRAQLLDDAAVLAHRGYAVLTYDSRGCGDSDGDLVTWGDKERRDVEAALGFLTARPDVDPKRIGVVGFSIGASAVALAAARDGRLRAVVLYATWTSLDEELKAKLGPLSAVTMGPTVATLEREGIAVHSVRPIDAVASIAPRPLLMIAGTRDADTPVEIMKRIFARAGDPKELWIEEGATHGTYVKAAPEEYERRVIGFFDRSL